MGSRAIDTGELDYNYKKCKICGKKVSKMSTHILRMHQEL